MDMFAAPRAGRVMNGKDDDVGEKNYLKKKEKRNKFLSVRSLLIRSVINGRHGNQRGNVSLLCHITIILTMMVIMVMLTIMMMMTVKKEKIVFSLKRVLTKILLRNLPMNMEKKFF